jgi:hypothetical protein
MKDNHDPYNIHTLPSHPSSINSNNLPTDIRARRTRQPNYHALEVLRSTPSARRNSLQDALRPVLILHQRSIHIRSNVPRRNCIHTDPTPCPFITQRFGQLPNTTFTRRVCRYCDSTLECEEGSDIDNGAAASKWEVCCAREHVCAYIAAQSKHRSQIHLQHSSPVLVWKFVGGMALLNASAVE